MLALLAKLVTPMASPSLRKSTNALAAFNAVGGAAYPDAKVPVENDNTTFGIGSLNSHWREEVFNNELMSPALNSPVDPISEVTVEPM